MPLPRRIFDDGVLLGPDHPPNDAWPRTRIVIRTTDRIFVEYWGRCALVQGFANKLIRGVGVPLLLSSEDSEQWVDFEKAAIGTA